MISNKPLDLVFTSEYRKLTETEKDKFSRICSKLLDKTFILKQKDTDKEDFFFVVGHLSLFHSYFQLINYSVTYHEADQLIMLSTDLDRNRVRLKKIDTIMLLILRQLYYEKSKEVTQLNQIIVTIGEIHESIERTNIFNSRISKTELASTFRMLKSFSIINYLSNNLIFDDETRIEIYPSILRIVNVNDINKLDKQLSAYTDGGDEDEEVDQD